LPRGQRGLAWAVFGRQSFAAVDANVLFGKALGLSIGLKVLKSEMDLAGRELKIWLDFESGSPFACPRCGAFCPVHDTVEKRSGGIWTFGSIAPSRLPECSIVHRRPTVWW
jgi:hypothetical protein